MSDRPLPVGKLVFTTLQRLLNQAGGISDAPEVVVGPGIGRDVAVLDTGGDKYLLAKSDPITFATGAIGYYLVNVNTNDIATSGGRPRWLLVTLLLPENETTEAMVEEIFDQITGACEKLDIALIGGHTEITYGLNRPLIIGMLLGEVDKGRLITPDGLQVGDTIIVTKQIPVEGTALIATEKRQDLKDAGFSDAFLHRCADMLFDPGIGVLTEALVAVDAGDVHAMHDPTEGGLATGLWEMADAAGLGMAVEEAAIPVRDEARQICAEYDLDPLGVIASGSLLIGCSPGDAAAIVEALHKEGITAAAIAQVRPRDEGVMMHKRDGETVDLPRYDQDELTKIL
ncbi:MAG: AIR synthase family protein [Armatimonadota bacterium]